MIAATPYLGGHYLLDLVAAVPVVALATIVAGRVVPRRGDERGGAWPWVAAALRRGAPARPRRGPAMPAA
jgi:membrane-associated phospholipid phosphatase